MEHELRRLKAVTNDLTRALAALRSENQEMRVERDTYLDVARFHAQKRREGVSLD